MEEMPRSESEVKPKGSVEYRLVKEFIGPAINGIDAYLVELIGDNDETALLADETKIDLRLNLTRLRELKDTLSKWRLDPSLLQLVSVMSTIDTSGSRISLAIQEKSDSLVLPTNMDQARLQIRVNIDTNPTDGEEYTDELIAGAYSGSSRRKAAYMNIDGIIDRASRKASEKAKITFSWERAYRDNTGIHPIKGPGIRFVHLGQKVASYGVHYVGTKPHVTESDLGLEADFGIVSFDNLTMMVGQPEVVNALNSRVRQVREEYKLKK